MKIIVILCSVMLSQALFAQNKPSLHEIPLKDINEKDTSLQGHKGEVLLVVNVASQCGLTPQYKALEAVHRFSTWGLYVAPVFAHTEVRI
jgi:glutathione peroxidase-family protein